MYSGSTFATVGVVAAFGVSGPCSARKFSSAEVKDFSETAEGGTWVGSDSPGSMVH